MQKQVKIAILGSGYYQKALIKKAKELGMCPIVFSGNNINSNDLRKVYNIPIYASDKISDICETEKIDGICSIGSEKAVQTIGLVNDRLHLKGISQNVAKLFTNKLRIKRLFQELQIKTPDFYVGFFSENKENIAQKCLSLTFPVVFKPIDNSNSTGIIKINSLEEIEVGISYVKSYTNRDRFIIEKFIEGISFGIESITINGNTNTITLGNISRGNEIDIPIGHYTPMDSIEQGTLEQALENVIKILSKNKIDMTTIDCRLSNNGEVFFLEVGARCGGTMIPEIISIHFGVDIYETIIKLAIGQGDTIKLRPTNSAIAASLIQTETEEEITNIINNNENNKWLRCSIEYQVEQNISQQQQNKKQIGRIITIGNTKKEALQRLKEATRRIEIKTQTNTTQNKIGRSHFS